MELLQLKYFTDAAECESFSETARRYSVPTSNISQSVKRLERELGQPLFEHSANRIRLNQKGRILLSAAKEALSLLEGAREAISAADGELFGEIRLVCMSNRRTVTEAIERFAARYPKVSFVIHHTIQRGDDFDILISDTSPVEYSKRMLLIDEEIMLALSASHPLSEKEGLSVKDLPSERFISMTEGSSIYRITVNACAEAGFAPNIAIQTDDPSYLRKYVEMGMGVALVPECSWRGLLNSDTVSLRPLGIRRKTYAYLPKSRYIKRASEVFLEILASLAE